MRIDNQNPSFTNVKSGKKKSRGTIAVNQYKATGQALFTWQQRQIRNIEQINSDGLWTFTTYCIAVSRRNGKGEILAARELDGILNLKEKICYTAHRTTTSHDAFNRLYTLLKKAGYEELTKRKRQCLRSLFMRQSSMVLNTLKLLAAVLLILGHEQTQADLVKASTF